MKAKVVLSILVCISITLVSSGQKIDSLNAVLDTAKADRKVKTLNELFRAYIQSDPVKALGFTREALNYATEIGDKKGLAASYNNLGIAYRNQGALDKALEYYITSLKIYESLNNKEGIATTKNNISNIYSMKRDYGQAMKYLEDSHNLFLELNDPSKIIGSLNNLGNLHSEIQLYEKAMKYFSEANQLSEKIHAQFADPLTNMGNIFFRQNNYQRAVEQYEKALTIERANDNKLGILNVITNLGITYTKAKQPKLADQYLNEAITLCDHIQAYSFLPSIYKAVGENYANQGKFKEAYESQLRFEDARNKIYSEESSRNIAQMEMILDFQEKEKEYEMLKKEDAIKTLELRNSRLFIVMIILGLFVILGGLNYYYLSKKKIIKKKA
jgi:tetratricopeptide (TPR) repeat protein